jgi:hypothetical protein
VGLPVATGVATAPAGAPTVSAERQTVAPGRGVATVGPHAMVAGEALRGAMTAPAVVGTAGRATSTTANAAAAAG